LTVNQLTDKIKLTAVKIKLMAVKIKSAVVKIKLTEVNQINNTFAVQIKI